MKKNMDLGLLILRVGFSALMLRHGIEKFMAFIGGNMSIAGDPLSIGELPSSILILIAEFVAPVLIIIGLKTRLMSIPVIIAVAIAAFVAHGGDPFAKKEMALLFLVGFLAIGFMGAGKLSMDRK